MKTKHFLSLSLLTLISVLSINTALAQIRLGVRGAVDVSSTKLNSDILKAKNRLGFQIGPTLEFIIPVSGFGGDVAVLYGRKEYKITEKQADATLSDYDYISVPINIKQRISFGALGIFFTGGVYGNVKIGDGESVSDVVNAYKHKDFIFGLGAGAGVTVLKNLDLGMYFRGDLTNNYKEEYMDAETFQNKKNQYWSVGLNYYF